MLFRLKRRQSRSLSINGARRVVRSISFRRNDLSARKVAGRAHNAIRFKNRIVFAQRHLLPVRGSGSGPGSVADWFWFIVTQCAEWQHIGNPFNAAMIFAEPTVANTIRVYPITQSAAVRIVCFTGSKDASCTMKKMEYEKLSEEK